MFADSRIKNIFLTKKIKTAIVFGGASLCGREICENLVDEKYYTFCIDDLSGKESIHPDKWESKCKSNPRFIFIQEKWEDFIDSEVCIETNIDIVVFLIGKHNKQSDNNFCKWIRTLTITPNKIVMKNFTKITKTPIWEFLITNE